MRCSQRKVVKYVSFLTFIFILNIWISYNVNLWSFNHSDERLYSNLVRSVKHPIPYPSHPVHSSVVEVANFVTYDGTSINGINTTAILNERTEWRRKDSFASVEREFNKHVSRNSELQVDKDKSKGGNEPLALAGAKFVPDFTLIQSEGTGAAGRKLKLKGSRVDRSDQLNIHLNPTVQSIVSSTPRLTGQGDPLSAAGVKATSASLLPKQTELQDIFISVKTTKKYHATRVRLLLQTWYQLAKEQVYLFTDAYDADLAAVVGDHVINTNCSADHSRRALSCKMAVEFDYYLASRKRWFCHMDDDIYLHVPRLVEVLRGYHHKQDWYLGKPSLKHPLEVAVRDTPGMKITFWFATGGAGFCISRSLALKMAPYAGGGRFMTTAETIRLPDDCTLGYIIEHLLKQKLTVVDEFHSHLEALWLIKPHQLKKQITLSFSQYSGKQNVINVQGFTEEEDPTRLRSLHCFLFPHIPECRNIM